MCLRTLRKVNLRSEDIRHHAHFASKVAGGELLLRTTLSKVVEQAMNREVFGMTRQPREKPRHLCLGEVTCDGDAFVCFDDGTYDVIKWNHMYPEPQDTKAT
jgi:hypothetical protein